MAKARCTARASVSFRMPKPSAKGSGEAYQYWNSAQASATANSRCLTRPRGWRPPVSESATSCCRASGALSISEAMVRSFKNAKRGEAAGLRPWGRSMAGAGAAAYLIQPFSL